MSGILYTNKMSFLKYVKRLNFKSLVFEPNQRTPILHINSVVDLSDNSPSVHTHPPDA